MNTVMLAFNLMSLMRQALMKHPDAQHSPDSAHPANTTLQALRQTRVHHNRGT